MRLGAWLVLLSSLLYACGDDDEPRGASDGAVDPSTGTDGDGGADADATPEPPPDCGDLRKASPEECDDGNRIGGDGCDGACRRELGFNCPEAGGGCTTNCGDGTVVVGEACDDGNPVAGDGCAPSCQVEQGWSCLGSGAVCSAALCGDGIAAGEERCDDGNQIPGDGCSTMCTIEPGWLCTVQGQPCTGERCGDSVRAGSEVCDDGDAESGDGCTADCTAVEPNHRCPELGGPCTRTSVCGNGLLTSDEECDDRNLVSGDGCSDQCKSEPGYLCAAVGRTCVAAACGDGILAGAEQCEDGNASPGDGCSDCRVESGWACMVESGRSLCHRAVCGDMKVEGDEACDDGNDIVGDGCGPYCRTEPRCSGGLPCTSTCGDGIKFASDNEECDDGNVRNGDGCSAECKVERGFTCADVVSQLPTTFDLTVTYRDLIRKAALSAMGYVKHPDFDSFFGNDATGGLVASELVDGKPGYTGLCELKSENALNPAICPYGAQTTSAADFGQWYANAPVPNVMLKFVQRLTMNRMTNGMAFQNATFGRSLFPLDNLGWVVTGAVEERSAGHNYGFTSEIRHWFEFKGGEVLTFSGDDDLWVFINGKLALDLGGLHARRQRTIVLDAASGSAICYLDYGLGSQKPCTENGGQPRALGIRPNSVYEMALFHAERAISESNFDLTLTGFIAARSECRSTCGDGVVTADEACDDGKSCMGGAMAEQACVDDVGCPGGTCVSRNDGTYGRCLPTCQGYGPHCGDGVKQDNEACDEGFERNRGSYNGCALDCQPGPRCGDGRVDGAYGEQCDQGMGNDGTYEGCTAMCRFAERCGDGVHQPQYGEACDMGINNSPYNGCGPGCKPAPTCGDSVVQRAQGEQCDQGAENDGRYGGCNPDCRLAPSCGDGVLHETEQCDDGNTNDNDGCSPSCRRPIVI